MVAADKVDETKRLQFLSYYYNAALDAGKEVVATYKDGFNNKGEVLDYERAGPVSKSSRPNAGATLFAFGLAGAFVMRRRRR